MKHVVLALALVFTWPTLASAGCTRNSYGVFEDITCAVSAQQLARKELDGVLAQLLGQLTPESAKALQTSQQAWAGYIKAEAAFVFGQEGDGSAGQLIFANTEEKATRARIKELRQWLSQK